jgi:dihydroorotase
MRIAKLADMHVHFRHTDEEMVRRVAPHSERVCEYAVAMPNTVPPTISAQQVTAGRDLIRNYAPTLKPLMMMKMEADCTPEMIYAAREAGAVGTKSYPEGVTTGSEVGLSEDVLNDPPQNLLDCWELQEKVGMVSSWHGEMPGSFVLDAEKDFLSFIDRLHQNYPKLKIVIEHITTHHAVQLVRYSTSPNLAATITLHHLILTLDDVLKDKLRPHNYCKPVAKKPYDREALLTAAFSKDPRFFLGSDSAPHMKKNKECAAGCAGVYTAPLLAEGLAYVFDHYDQLDSLEGFACFHGSDFYGLPRPQGRLDLRKTPFVVPEECEGVVPFMAGQTLKWSVDHAF